ncbi:hypothetical protein BCAR13_120178 [Paraburkholderia caribensis]|nr:hypothetical protein BCAR13_120178 [Paraburkholderia caribensis]
MHAETETMTATVKSAAAALCDSKYIILPRNLVYLYKAA